MNNTKTKSKEKIIKAWVGYGMDYPERGEMAKSAEIIEVSISSKDTSLLQEFCQIETDRPKARRIIVDNYLQNPVININHDYSRNPIGKVLDLKVLKTKIKMKVQIAKYFLEERDREQKENKSQRLKILYISPVIITKMFTAGKHSGYYLDSGLPEDASIVGAVVTSETGTENLKLVIESSSFPEVQNGKSIPEYKKPFVAHQLKTDDVDYYGRNPEKLNELN